MSAHDDLREAIARALCDLQGYWDDEAEEDRDGFRVDADAVLAVLPQHAAAVLATLGTVREGWLWHDDGPDSWSACSYGRVPHSVSGPHDRVALVSLGAAANDADDLFICPVCEAVLETNTCSECAAAKEATDDA